MSEIEDATPIEANANEQIPDDAENVTFAPEPMLCPPACVAAGFALGILGACAVERCTSASASIETESGDEIEPSDSVDDILEAVN